MNITISIRTSGSADAVRMFKSIINERWKLKEVRMDYNTLCLPDYDYPDSYPVTVIFSDNNRPFEIKIAALSAGYGGTGPMYFERLLSFLGIEYDEDDFYTKRRIDEEGYIRLRYYPR